MSEIQELYDVITKINDEIYEAADNDDYCEFTLEILTNSLYTLVNFLGVRIWCSEDDARRYDDNDVQESFDAYFRRVINETVRLVGVIKL